MNGISFTGREEMLTAGFKSPKKVAKSIEEAAGYFNLLAPHGKAEVKATEAAKASANAAVDSYVASHQPILSSPIAKDSAVAGEHIEFFG